MLPYGLPLHCIAVLQRAAFCHRGGYVAIPTRRATGTLDRIVASRGQKGQAIILASDNNCILRFASKSALSGRLRQHTGRDHLYMVGKAHLLPNSRL